MGFTGNKAALPSKTCQTCGREMSWRKIWAKNWEEVKYGSQACRASKRPPGEPAQQPTRHSPYSAWGYPPGTGPETHK